MTEPLSPIEPDAAEARSRWVMLLALCCGFLLSQAYRSVGAMMAGQLRDGFGLSPSQLGAFAAAFHFSFGGMQLFMGIGIDQHGVRRTVLTAFPFAIAGAVLAALAPNYPLLILSQILIGMGCAPAFLVCTVCISRRFPPRHFAAMSGLTLGLGGVGMLITGTPLAWLVEAWSWRAGFAVLALASVGAWLLMYRLAQEGAVPTRNPQRQTFGVALRQFFALFAQPQTLGIMALGAVTYAAFITLRGLWLGPLLTDRFGFSLVQSGNVALVVSLVGLFGPPLFGRIDPLEPRRRRWIIAGAGVQVLLFALLASGPSASIEVAAAVLIAFLGGVTVLQYANVRGAYPDAMVGRAMAMFTMAMFLGVAVMQSLTGFSASLAKSQGLDPYAAVLYTIAALLLAGTLAFALAPRGKVST